jgi:hypothetical protein
VSRRLLVSLVALGLLAVAPGAQADTQFGGDPTQAITPGISCQLGAPTGFEFPAFFIGTQGSQSCMWSWSNPSVGSDIVPIPVTGGSGTITSVTLPAMPSPGPMQVVVLTAALNATSEPSRPDYICCQVKQVGPTFTVPANQVTTVTQSLHVSATEEANLSQPGDTSFGDLLGVSVISPAASLPIRYTGNNGSTSVTNFDGDSVYYPAPSGANGEYQTPLDPVGFQLLARFNLALDGPPAPAPGPAPVPAPAGANGGLKLGKGALQLGQDGKTLTLGQATNPPTAGTTQTLTIPTAARASASAKGGKRKAMVVGSGKTTVPSGKTVPVKLKLNGKGKAALKKQGSLHATLTVVATNPQGQKQTTTRAVVVKPAKQKKQAK